MDVPRENVARRRWIRRGVTLVVSLAAVGAISIWLSRLEPAAPSVDQATVWSDTVKRGLMVREVRGTGSLVPEVVWWIPAPTAGRIERVLVLPGLEVEADTVLLELSNPELELAAVNAEWQLKSAEAELVSLEAMLARVHADHHEALLREEVDNELFKDGLISQRNLKLSRVRVEELAKLSEIEERRFVVSEESQPARVASQRASVEQARSLYELKRSQVGLLSVWAGRGGLLEQLPVQVGQQVAPGTILAKVTDPTSLKAVLRIPETQAREG